MGGSDTHMNPRRARREMLREMGFDKYGLPLEDKRELTPEELLQHALNMQPPRARNKTVVEQDGKWYQCRVRPKRFWHGTPTEWQASWVEVPPGTPGPAPEKPPRQIAKAFSHGRSRDCLVRHLAKRGRNPKTAGKPDLCRMP
jgi:hypothetical protein